MSEKIFIIGHKSPDLDSVAAAINFAELKNKSENTDRYEARIAGEINKVTDFILNKFSIEKPAILENADEKEIILVDHNEFSQAVNGIEKAKILEILDHHKLNFSYSDPIRIDTWPIGSTNSILFKKFKETKIELSQKTASLMLSAVLDDTVITKSPTTTDEDKTIIEELSKIAGIEDWKNFGIEMFKTKSAFNKMSEMEIIKSDFKDFSMKKGKIGVGQVETVDLNDFNERIPRIINELESIRLEGSYHSTILFITDIINEGSLFLVSSENQTEIENAMEIKFENNSTYVPGLLSRKKQVAPKLSQAFDK